MYFQVPMYPVWSRKAGDFNSPPPQGQAICPPLPETPDEVLTFCSSPVCVQRLPAEAGGPSELPRRPAAQPSILRAQRSQWDPQGRVPGPKPSLSGAVPDAGPFVSATEWATMRS